MAEEEPAGSVVTGRGFFCGMFGGHKPRTLTVFESGDGDLTIRGERLTRCQRCGETLDVEELSPAAICAIAGHDLDQWADSIDELERTDAGQIVKLAFVRRSTCSRCLAVVVDPVPPEQVPADVFELVERELAGVDTDERRAALTFRFTDPAKAVDE